MVPPSCYALARRYHLAGALSRVNRALPGALRRSYPVAIEICRLPSQQLGAIQHAEARVCIGRHIILDGNISRIRASHRRPISAGTACSARITPTLLTC